LTQVSNGVTASYTYDGDGNRVKAVVNSTTSIYVGAYYEVTGGVVKKYYYAGSVRVAENNGGVLHFLLTDHLGSTAVTTSDTGVRVTELRYYPYGDSARYNPGGQITTFRFTGQRWDPGTGLYFYGARWYDSSLGRFIQADTIVPQPGNPQSLNRYAYVLNNPLRYTDPTGHAWREDDSGGSWRWWESAQARQRPFSIHSIQPGGLYGYGEAPLGDRLVSVYLPPTVRSYVTTDGLLPLYEPKYDLPMVTAFAPRHQIADYWYGEEAPGRNAVAPHRWKTVTTQRRVEGPNLEGFFAGLGRGLAATPEDLPLAPDATKAEVRANAAATGFSVLNGIAGAGWESNFVLQESVRGSHYRVIILTRPGYASDFFYATRVNLNPVTLTPIDWGPGPFLPAGR
jgi:RHS repeat-associated protein